MQRVYFPNSVRSVRDINRSRVLRCIEQWPGISRKGITQKIGLTDAPVSRISREVIDCGLVVEDSQIASNGRPGRRHVGLAIRPEGGFVFAVCLTVSDKSLTLLDLSGEPVANDTLADDAVSDFETLINVIVRQAAKLRTKAGVPRHRILGMATVLAGSVNHNSGFVNISSLDVLSQTPLASALEDRLKIPVQLETIGNALNIAHKRNEQSISNGQTTLLVHIAMGMGASWIIDGIPYRAEHDERTVGYIPIANAPADSPPLESAISLLAAASGYAILCQIHGINADPSGENIATKFAPEVLAQAITSAHQGDEKMLSLFRLAGEKLGYQLCSICAALPPGQITLAGPIPQVAAYEEAVRHGLSNSFDRLGVAPPQLSVSQIGYLRAAELFALEEFLYRSRLNLKQLLAD